MGLLRLLLAAFVVFEHCALASGLRLLPGYVAVEVFFVISGFYMAMILDGKYDKYSADGIAKFYVSRFFRLWPAYIVVIALALMLRGLTYLFLGYPAMGAAPFGEWLSGPAQVLLAFSNFTILGQDLTSLFHASASGLTLTWGQNTGPLDDGSVWLGYARIIMPAWTLGTEMWFYLLAPFLLRLGSRSIAAIVLILLCVRAWFELFAGLQSYFLFPLQLPLFLIGSLAYRHGPRSGLLAGLPIVAVVVAAGLIGAGLSEYFKWFAFLAVAIGIAALFEKTRSWRVDRTIGEQSYEVYVVHWLVLSVLNIVAKRAGFHVTGEILLLAVLPLAYLLYRVVDVPVGKWRARLVT
jgi:peptidoglycan/LPS O-acetylase OafA/YrhL